MRANKNSMPTRLPGSGRCNALVARHPALLMATRAPSCAPMRSNFLSAWSGCLGSLEAIGSALLSSSSARSQSAFAPTSSGRCFVQFPVALPRSVEHSVELHPAQSPIHADFLFGFRVKVEAAEDLAVALDAKLLEHLAHDVPLLTGDDSVQCAQLRRLDGLERRRVVGRGELPASKMIGRQVASQARHEAAQPRWVSKLAAANPLQRNAKGLLVQIVEGGWVCPRVSENESDAAAEPFNQLSFGRRIAGPNPFGEAFVR